MSRQVLRDEITRTRMSWFQAQFVSLSTTPRMVGDTDKGVMEVVMAGSHGGEVGGDGQNAKRWIEATFKKNEKQNQVDISD